MIWSLDEAAREHNQSLALAGLLCDILPKGIPVIDYGCGPGFYVAFLEQRGYQITGVEGTPGIFEIAFTKSIEQHDLTKPMARSAPHNVICLEVAEHIKKDFEEQFLQNITLNCAGRIVMSWAVPGQGGHGHVNEQPNAYVIDRMAELGFKINNRETYRLRRSLEGDPCWWFQNTIMVFDL